MQNIECFDREILIALIANIKTYKNGTSYARPL